MPDSENIFVSVTSLTCENLNVSILKASNPGQVRGSRFRPRHAAQLVSVHRGGWGRAAWGHRGG